MINRMFNPNINDIETFGKVKADTLMLECVLDGSLPDPEFSFPCRDAQRPPIKRKVLASVPKGLPPGFLEINGEILIGEDLHPIKFSGNLVEGETTLEYEVETRLSDKE